MVQNLPRAGVTKKISRRVYGYFIDIDLSSGHIRKRSLGDDLIRKFSGGTGSKPQKYFMMGVGSSIDPFDERNVLIITAGPLVATGHVSKS